MLPREAFTVALSGRPGPVFVELPFDVLFNVGEAPEPLPVERTRPILPEPNVVEQIAGLIRQAKKLLIIAGSQVYWDEAGEALR